MHVSVTANVDTAILNCSLCAFDKRTSYFSDHRKVSIGQKASFAQAFYLGVLWPHLPHVDQCYSKMVNEIFSAYRSSCKIRHSLNGALKTHSS